MKKIHKPDQISGGGGGMKNGANQFISLTVNPSFEERNSNWLTMLYTGIPLVWFFYVRWKTALGVNKRIGGYL